MARRMTLSLTHSRRANSRMEMPSAAGADTTDTISHPIAGEDMRGELSRGTPPLGRTQEGEMARQKALAQAFYDCLIKGVPWH